MVEVVDCYGCVDVLICNSSMKLKAPVQNISLEIDRNIMDINYFGPSTLAKGESDARFHSLFSACRFLFLKEYRYLSKYVTGVLPTMISRRSGHIVLVNSIQGRLAVPFRSSCELLIYLFFGQIHVEKQKRNTLASYGTHMTGHHLVCMRG